MKKVIVEGFDKTVEWQIEGSNETPCMNDIQNNKRIESNDYLVTMFRQRYGCKAKIINITNKSK
jgi:hypothetical protein